MRYLILDAHNIIDEVFTDALGVGENVVVCPFDTTPIEQLRVFGRSVCFQPPVAIDSVFEID